MALNSWKQTWLTLTTSLDNKGRQKSNFLDISSNTNYFDTPFLDNVGVFDDNYNEDFITPSLPIIPPLTPTDPSTIKGSIVGAMDRMNKSFNLPTKTHWISPWYFFTHITLQ